MYHTYTFIFFILVCYQHIYSSGTDDIATACSICREDPNAIVPDIYKPQGFVDCYSGFPTLTDTVFCGGVYCPMCPSTVSTTTSSNILKIPSEKSGVERSSAFSSQDNVTGFIIVVGILLVIVVIFFIIVLLYMVAQLQQANQEYVNMHKDQFRKK